MLKNYDDKKVCMMFYNIYQYVMIDLGVQSMHGKLFFMNV